MRYGSLEDVAKAAGAVIGTGPAALVFIEDGAAVERTIRHHLGLGFRAIAVFGPSAFQLPAALAGAVHYVPWDMGQDAATESAVNRVIAAAPGAWLYYCYNAEFLFHPFAEDRTAGEMLAFHAEERRSAMLTYVIDVYAGDLQDADNAVSLADAWLDRSGYYARARTDENGPLDRQLDFHGGLRWRFEEHIDPDRRRIDRVAIVRTKPGLRLRDDHTWSEAELNTYACPWHNNLTAAIVSFRTAKALRTNPASRFHIDTFRWHNSLRFEWRSQQLMDLGLMEPGQWF